MLITCVLRTLLYIISSNTDLLFMKHNGLIHRHALSQHGNKSDQKHQCDMCDKGFNNKQALEGHKNWHLNLKPFQCRLASNSSLITSQGSTVYIFPPANKDENLIVYNPKRQTFKAFYLVFDAIFSFLLFPFFIFPLNLHFSLFFPSRGGDTCSLPLVRSLSLIFFAQSKHFPIISPSERW